ncbi:ATP-binding protein [Streptomyces sp. NPDC002577]
MNVPVNSSYYLVEVEARRERVPQIRRIVAAHLRYWRLANHIGPMCRGVDELMLNVVEHTGDDKRCVVELWWNGKNLIAAVADYDRRMPRLLGPTQGGLARIAAMSDGWGAYGTPDGKLVWFSRRVKALDREPLAWSNPAPFLQEAKRGPESPSLVPVGIPLIGLDDVREPERELVEVVPAARLVRQRA